MGTPLGRVRGLGSAKQGSLNWYHERLSSVATLLLFIWFVVSLIRLPRLDYEMTTKWLSSPLAAVPMVLLIYTTFWHAKDGLRVVVEDYVHDEGNKFFWLALVNFLFILGGGLAIFAVLSIAFGGAAKNG
ncbi:MAG TPA: succinate dehydrogenase, hydrophobic membrane anchor protein [Allosphingosinicella sp.]|jgi:succinate dehydrogenase / fumarate reductase membrane anchor subunit